MGNDSFAWNNVPGQYSNAIRSQASIGENLLETISFHDTDHVLDAGCGVGNLTLEIARKVPCGSVTGMDISQSRVEECKELFQKEQVNNGTFYVSKIEDITEADRYDIVFTNAVLQWISSMDTAAENFYRALRLGGTLAIQFPLLNDRHPMMKFPKRVISQMQMDHCFENYIFPSYVPTEEELKNTLTSAGFSNIQIRSSTTTFSFPTAEKLFHHFKNVGYSRFAEQLPEAEREEFYAHILQEIEKDYAKNEPQYCDRFFAYAVK